MLSLVPAGIMARTSAWLLDVVLRGAILVGCFVPFLLLGETGLGLYIILTFLVNWLYPVVFEVWRDGMTPGKKYSGIYVCHDDGTPINLQSSLIRNLLRVVDFLPFFYSVGVLSLMFNRKSQRLGDMVAGTIVVYQERDDISKIYKSIYGLIESEQFMFDDAPQLQAQTSSQVSSYDVNSPLFHFPLNLTEQQALLSLSDRLLFLPITRQKEITNHLSPLVYQTNKLGIGSANAHTNGYATGANPDVVYQAVLARSRQLKGK